MNKPFQNLSEFAIHKERIRIEHARRKRVLERHVEALQDPQVRKQLAKNSASHWVESIEPLRIAKSAVTSVPALAGVVGLLVGLRSKHPIAKTVGSLATFAMPMVFAQVKNSQTQGASQTEPPAVRAELRESWSRIKRYIQRRQQDRSAP